MTAVVVTGGAGFVGRRLVRRLIADGCPHVVSFDAGAQKEARDARVQIVQGDILSGDDLLRALPEGAIVVHTAAMTHAEQSLREPEACFQLNVMGTVRALDAARAKSAAGFVFLSTGLVYGTPASLPVDESHATVPLTPYAASKLAAEHAVLAYARSYGFGACVLRLSNVYGPGGHPDTVHAAILSALLAGGDVELRDLDSIRDFIHVDDVVEGIVRAIGIMRSDLHAVVNLSAGRGQSILEFARAFADAHAALTGKKVEVRQREPGKAAGVRELVFANNALAQLTGWQPRTTVQQGAAATLNELLKPSPNPI